MDKKRMSREEEIKKKRENNNQKADNMRGREERRVRCSTS